jgi:hypothetical protein
MNGRKTYFNVSRRFLNDLSNSAFIDMRLLPISKNSICEE